MSDASFDVAIVGGGPIGLAVGIEARKHSLRTVILERQTGDVDKACGEGLMPAGARWLEENAVLHRLTSSERRRFVGIRYVSEDGTVADGLLPGTGGLGVRRLALSRVLRQRAREVGVELREGAVVREVTRSADGVELVSEGRERHSIRAQLVVAADGLHSTVRASAGLALESSGPSRFGMRRHFELAPWSEFVEVHFQPGAEAYITPVGDRTVGVAFLWSPERCEAKSYEELLALFPEVERRVRDAAHASTVRGAGALLQRVSRPVSNRLVLMGDAAGYVDALTGEGLTLGFQAAAALGAALPGILAKGASVDSFIRYERQFKAMFDKYAWLTHSLLAVGRRPAMRRAVLKLLAFSPGLFEAALAEAMPAA